MEYFPGFNTLQLRDEFKKLLYRLGETPENFTGRILFMSMFNDISCGTKDNEEECLANARLYLCMQEDLEKDNGHSLVLVLKRSGTLKLQKDVVGIRRERMSNFSVLRLHCPEVNSKAKDMVNYLSTLQPTRKRLTLFFA